MDWWILKQLRAQVLSDLQEFIPDGHFTQDAEHFTIPNEIEGSKHFSDEIKWGILATKLGEELLYTPPALMTARQVAASDTLMNLGLLVSTEAKYDLLLKFSQLAGDKDVSTGNVPEVAAQLEKEHLPTFKKNLSGAIGGYLNHLEEREKRPFIPLDINYPKTDNVTTKESKPKEKRENELHCLIKKAFQTLNKPKNNDLWKALRDDIKEDQERKHDKEEKIQEMDRENIRWRSWQGNEQNMSRKTFNNYLSKLRKLTNFPE